MKLYLKRTALKADYTIGRLSYSYQKPGGRWTRPVKICDTLEPAYLPALADVAGSGAAIRPGTYNMVVSYSPKFKRWLPLLIGTGNRSGIRIHAGNLPADTEGCILVGTNDSVGKLSNSRKALQSLMDVLRKHQKEGEVDKISIE